MGVDQRIVEASSLLRDEAKITETKIVFPRLNATITAIAHDAASAAGSNACLANFDELWAFTSSRAERLFDEMVPPPTRKVACRLTTTFAGFSGESTLLESLYQRGLSLPQIGPDLYGGNGMLMFWTHQCCAPWQTQQWLDEMRLQLRPNQYLRMIENRFVGAETSFIDLVNWDACVRDALTPVLSDRSLHVWAAVDASVKHDATALVACTFDKKAQCVRLVTHRVFQPTPDDPIDFEGTIEATLRDWHKRFRLRKVWYDPYQMAAVAQRLAKAGIKLEEYPQTTGNLTAASQNLYELLIGRNLALYPDAAMRLAASRAIAVEGARGWRLDKAKASHKIDVIVALSMAALGAIRGQSESSYDHFYRGFGGEPPAADNILTTERRPFLGGMTYVGS